MVKFESIEDFVWDIVGEDRRLVNKLYELLEGKNYELVVEDELESNLCIIDGDYYWVKIDECIELCKIENEDLKDWIVK